jgi:hypothetical protein
MKKSLLPLLLGLTLAGCAAGPCWEAMKYRQAAETAQGTEKAALLGKADALQAQCDARNKEVRDSQNHNAKYKDHP